MISLYDMLEAADGQLFGEPSAQIFSNVVIDIAQVEAGCLYVALNTGQSEDHLDLHVAVERGALGLVCTQPPDFDTTGLTVMIVRDPEQSLMNWARIVMKKFGTTVIGIAGSTCKSMTASCIAEVLRAKYEVYHSTVSYGSRIGLPVALGKLTAQHQVAILEFSCDQPGDMTELVEITQPLVGVVTNISPYTDVRWGSAERLATEYKMLLSSLPENGLCVINYDDPLVRGLGSDLQADTFSIAIDSFEADLLAYNVMVGRFKTGFDLRYNNERIVGNWLPLLSRHAVYAAMTALAVGLSFQVPVDEGLNALKQLAPLSGRLQPLAGINNTLLIDDTFNSSPFSVETALEWLGSIKEEQGRLIFVLGDLDGTTAHMQRVYRQLGEAAASIVDLFISQGNQASAAARAALEAGMARSQVRMTFGHQDTWKLLQNLITAHDVTLVEGSVSAGTSELVQSMLRDKEDVQLLASVGRHGMRDLGQRMHPSWVDVDLGVVGANVRLLRQVIAPEVTLMALVPADAYGHGAFSVASTALLNGAGYLGVESLDEAVKLREAGIEAPILAMGYLSPGAMRDAIHYDLTVVVADLNTARAGNRLAVELRRTLRIHVQFDTGAGRMGLLPQDAMGFFRSLANLENIEIEGFFTELVMSPKDPDFAEQQLATFDRVVGPLRAAGIQPTYIHAADSHALLTLPQSQYSMVRSGALLLGLTPASNALKTNEFKPALTWKTVIGQVKTLPRNHYVGTTGAYRTSNEERIAVIPVGYADGLRAKPFTWQEVLVRGKRVPIVGTPGIHQTAINISTVPAARHGDEVVLIGRQASEVITVNEAADWIQTNSFELLNGILTRTPRL